MTAYPQDIRNLHVLRVEYKCNLALFLYSNVLENSILFQLIEFELHGFFRSYDNRGRIRITARNKLAREGLSWFAHKVVVTRLESTIKFIFFFHFLLTEKYLFILNLYEHKTWKRTFFSIDVVMTVCFMIFTMATNVELTPLLVILWCQGFCSTNEMCFIYFRCAKDNRATCRKKRNSTWSTEIQTASTRTWRYIHGA